MGIGGFIVRATMVTAMVLAISGTTADAQQQAQQTAQSQNQADADAARRDTASFNQFLNAHPDVEKQLHANPYLINDPNFLSTQPALKAFLSDHPHVKGQLQESPVDFVRRQECRKDRRLRRYPERTGDWAHGRVP